MTSSAETPPRPRGAGSLARRYFAVIGLGIALVLLAAIAVETTFSYRERLADVARMQVREVQAAAGQVEQFLGTVNGILRESLDVPWAQPAFGAEDRRTEFHRLMKIVPSLDSIRAVDQAGHVRIAVSRRDLDRPAETVFSAPALLARARKDGAAVGPVFRNGTEPSVMLAAANRGESGEVLVAELNLRAVSDIVTGLKVGSSGHAFLVDADNRLIAHRDHARTLLPPSPDAVNQLTAARRRLDETGIAMPFETLNGEGVSVFTAAVRIRYWDWMVLAEEPTDAALAPVRATLFRLLALLALGLLVAMLLSVVLARQLSAPILAVRRGAERIAGGDFAARIDVETGDEVEALAREFNVMAAQLQDYTAGLERKVEQKTFELQAALKVAQDAVRARTLFLAAASHDLRQPLYAISLLADTLGNAGLNVQGEVVLEKQRQAIDILRKLFDNLLDLSRFDAGEVRPLVRIMALQDVLGPVATEHEILCQAKGLQWRCEIADAWVSCDPELVRRLAGNLLSNAVRYTSEGSVGLMARSSGDEVEVSISDTGCGIAQGDQERIFDEFVQLSNPARDRSRGVGLGLSIVKRIADLLHAGLRLESQPGRGTTVKFRLPIAARPAEPETLPAPPDADEADLSGLRLWVVEDDAMVRSALELQLASNGIDYAFATTREEIEALRASDGQWPDAVMLDDMLGTSESGLALARWLATHVPARAILIVTGNVDPTRLAQLGGSGFQVARKPVPSRDLLAWLRASISGTAPDAAHAGGGAAR